MATLLEIEAAVECLSPAEKLALYQYLANQLAAPAEPARRKHRIIDIAPVHVGGILVPLDGEDEDLLGEMLEGRL